MAWVKLDDNFHWHPKVAPLSDGAYRLYVGALCYCNRYQCGDVITADIGRKLVGDPRKFARTSLELVSANLWDFNGVSWQIHDYFRYQPDLKKQAAGRVGGQASAQARAEAFAQAPSRTRPVPVPLVLKEPPSPPVENSTAKKYGIPETSMHVHGLSPLSQTLNKVILQSTAHKEAV